VRIALAHLLNVEAYIKNLSFNMANRVTSPIHPSRSYYHQNLKALDYNPEKSKQILAGAGWKDIDGDGVLDKKMKDGKTSLKFKLLVAGEMGQKIALILQEEAKKVGVEITAEKKEMGQFMKDINERTFDLVATNILQSPSPYDPFQSWHSSNAKPGGSNRCGIIIPALDEAIDLIRFDVVRRKEAYLKFQEILYQEQVQWFLFSPQTKLVASNKILLTPSIRKPGFLENMIREKK
jgi:microcin C transport system substrate-binding protein